LTGRFAAGEGRRRDPGIAQDALDDAGRNEQRLKATLREAAARDDVGEIQRRLRHIRRVLEDADVARHQRRRGEPHGLPQRKVPRHDGQHHPKGLIPDICLGCADRWRVGGLVGEQLLGVLGVEAKTLGALERFGLGRGQRLTHFEGHHGCGFVGLLFQQVGGGVGPLGALGEGGGMAVVEEPLVGTRDCCLDFIVGCRGEGLDRLAGGRVDRGDGHADILRVVGENVRYPACHYRGQREVPG
jgi:hypothetical protein